MLFKNLECNKLFNELNQSLNIYRLISDRSFITCFYHA